MRFFEASFRDAAEQEGALPRWQQEYRQLSCGDYVGEISAMILPGVEIYRERINVATEQLFSAPENTAVFYHYNRRDASELVRGAPSYFGTGFASDWNDRVGFMDAGSDLLMVVIDQSSLPAGSHFVPAGISQAAGKQAEFVAEWLVSLLQIGNNLRPEMPGEIAHVLPGLIRDRLDVLMDCAGQCEPMDTSQQERLYRKLRDAIYDREHDMAFSVSGLAKDLGVSPRSLRSVCLQFADMSLDELLLGLRLNGARRDLQKASATDRRTVSAIAMDWGFMHWSRFAARYRNLFGENPSQTLRAPRGIQQIETA